MNLIAATMLSTKNKAYSLHKQPTFWCFYKLQYVFIVEERQEGDKKMYLLQLFHITYPDAEEGQSLGKPHMAEKSHFDKRCTFEELKAFLGEREFNVDGEWLPVEDDTELVGRKRESKHE